LIIKDIYIKTEPAGEIGFGKLNDDDIKSIKGLLKSKELKGSEFIDSPHNFTQESAYGVLVSDEDTIDGELPKYNCIETISFLKGQSYEDGWYLIHTALSKGSIQFEFQPEGGSFDINQLELQYQKLDLGELSDDIYGDLQFNILSDFIYKGRSIIEYQNAELIDRGMDREVHIVEIKGGEFNLVYKNRNIEDEDYYKGGVLVAPEDKSLDREQALAAVSIDGLALEGLDDSFKKDKAIVLAAINEYGDAFKYAHESLKKDKEIVLAAINEYGGAFEYAHESLKKDREVLLASLAEHVFAMEDTDDSFKKDKEFVMEAININGHALEFIDESFKKDKEIVMQALRQNGEAFEYADESLKNDKEFVLDAVSVDGQAVLYHTSESLKNDKEVVLAAIKQNPDAIYNASDELQDDAELKKIALG
tara:strand:- start:814 stop:2076 length:1263 start_codon:yes stop_codon:yes gene_type:complete